MPLPSAFVRALAWLLAAAALASAAGCGGGGTAPMVRDGVLDLRGHDWQGAPVALDGTWAFTPSRFASPQAGAASTAITTTAAASTTFVQVPGPWNGVQAAGQPLGAHGFGTYRLTVLCDDAAALALSLPVQHSAMRLYVNGREAASQGTPGETAALARPASLQQIAHLERSACPLDIVAHVSNFDIRRGGLVRSLTLGTPLQLHERHETGLARDLFTMGALVVVGLLPILFFFIRRQDRSPLYFGLFCLLFALYVGLSGERVLQPLVAPLGWNVYIKLVFLSWTLTQVLFALFAWRQYPAQFNRNWLRAIAGWGAAASAVVLLTPSSLFTQGLVVLQAGAVAIFACMVVVLARAIRQRRSGARMMLAGLLALAAAIAHDAVYFSHLLTLSVAPWGVLAFVSGPAMLLARRFSRALSAEELRSVEQRERADLVLRATKAGVLDWDAVAGTVTYSDRYQEMLGYPPEGPREGIGHFYESIHPDDREGVSTVFVAQLRDRSFRNTIRQFAALQYRLRRADGSWLWVHAEGIGVMASDGRTLRFICSFIDISATKQHEGDMAAAERALKSSQVRLEAVVRAARVGIVDWDGHTHATWYSPRFREIRGYAPDADTSDWPDYFKVMIHPDDRGWVTKRWVPFIMGRGPEGQHGEFYSPEEYRMSRADGSYAWVLVSGVAVRDAKGFVTRWIAAVIDTTGRREQEEALRVSRDQITAQAAQLELQNEALKENVRLREEVERIGRHDIKTPLNSIIAVPRLLREERELSADEDDLLGIVERAGYRILSMVNLSLDLYKMEHGSYIFRPDAVDLADLTAKVVADLRSHAASRGVTLEAARTEGPPAYAWAEELLCYSLIANLLKNALEASPQGGTVTVTLRRDDAHGTVRMDIHNAGAIPLSIRKTFFQKYATAGKASGTGLGAYSARLMARVQDGGISMHTSDEEGTTLSVLLKAAPAGTVPTTVRHVGERSRGAVQHPPSLPALDVLLVDDDEYNLLIVRRYLPTPPLTVTTAINGRLGVDAAMAHWPDVIVMDLDMPVMGGMEAVHLLRDHERAHALRRCRIIALSSHDDDATQRAALAAGFDQYLAKPVTRQALQGALLQLAQAMPVDVPPGDTSGEGSRDVVIDPDMRALIPDFIASRIALLDEMERAIGSEDRGAVKRIAHQLAGSFSLYGFHWASARSRGLEAVADSVALSEALSVGLGLRVHLGAVAGRLL